MTLGQRHRLAQRQRRRSFEECALDVLDIRAYMTERQQRRMHQIPTPTRHAA